MSLTKTGGSSRLPSPALFHADPNSSIPTRTPLKPTARCQVTREWGTTVFTAEWLEQWDRTLQTPQGVRRRQNEASRNWSFWRAARCPEARDAASEVPRPGGHTKNYPVTGSLPSAATKARVWALLQLSGQNCDCIATLNVRLLRPLQCIK